MGKMAGKVVGAELIFGIETLGVQILSPFRQLRPILIREIPVALCAASAATRISMFALSSTGI